MKNYTIKNNARLQLCSLFLIAIAIVSNIGCARTMQAHTIPAKELQTEATRIYIFRPSFIGLIVKTNIYENNIISGQIGPMGYLAWDTKPGDITLEGGHDFVKILAQPGKAYYFKLRPNYLSLSLKSAFSLIKISEEEGKKYLEKLKEPRVKVVS